VGLHFGYSFFFILPFCFLQQATTQRKKLEVIDSNKRYIVHGNIVLILGAMYVTVLAVVVALEVRLVFVVGGAFFGLVRLLFLSFLFICSKVFIDVLKWQPSEKDYFNSLPVSTEYQRKNYVNADLKLASSFFNFKSVEGFRREKSC
jgi:hypothetical protein